MRMKGKKIDRESENKKNEEERGGRVKHLCVVSPCVLSGPISDQDSSSGSLTS